MNHFTTALAEIPADIFRAYDIRGIVDKTLTEEVVHAIGLAIGNIALAAGEKTIVIGRDGRLSGPALSKALAAGLLASGINVVDVGAIPTPVLYFATCTQNDWVFNEAQIKNLQEAKEGPKQKASSWQSRSGVMLTGSHNPPDYNGLKIIIAGKTLAGEEIQAIYQFLLAAQFKHGTGHYQQREIINDYIHTIQKSVQLKKKLKVVIDCGNGITGHVAPQLFKALGCEVIELFCEVDGRFPNHHPDPTQPENVQDLIKAVLANQADIGFGFDGDGDRVGVITNKGETIYADQQLMLFARDLLKRYPGSDIIFDVKCTQQLPKIIAEYGGKPLMWKTGHSFIKAKMAEMGCLLAGEMSGHLFFKERWFGFDDGMYAAVRLLEILSQEQQSISQIFQQMPVGVNTPELKLPMPDAKKQAFMQQFIAHGKFENAKINTIDGIRVDFADGWGLLRPSNTTPYLILRFEANNATALQRIENEFRQQLLQINPDLQLPF